MDRAASLYSLVACHECDYLHRNVAISFRGKALCRRCGAFLYRRVPGSIEKALALNTAALILFILSNAFPFLSLKIHGRFVENYFLSGAFQLYHLGMGEVGLLVMLTSFLFPLMTTMGMLYLLCPVSLGYRPWKMAGVFRMVCALKPWALVSVFMLGVLISFVKLLDMADIIPGAGVYAFAGLMVILAAANAAFDPGLIWPLYEAGPSDSYTGMPKAVPIGSARANGLVACHTCGRLSQTGIGRCQRCGTRVHSRKIRSIERTWALLFAAAIAFIPANVYPVMTVIQLGRGYPSTILGGVIHLIEGGTWVLALIIFFCQHYGARTQTSDLVMAAIFRWERLGFQAQGPDLVVPGHGNDRGLVHGGHLCGGCSGGTCGPRCTFHHPSRNRCGLFRGDGGHHHVCSP